MRIIPFPPGSDRGSLGSLPGPDDREATARWLTEVDDALRGGAAGAAAESWRRLEQDVRALAPPLDPQFERTLQERLKARRAASGPARRGSWQRRLLPTWGSRRPALAALVTLALLAIVVPAAIIESGSGQGGTNHSVAGVAGPVHAGDTASGKVDRLGPSQPTPSVPSSSAQPAAVTSTQVKAEEQLPAAAGQSGRLQQRAASITLTSAPSAVQELADKVSALAAADGGFVAHSQVQQQSHGTSEAQLTLQLPSAKLAGALAALGRLAPVQSQSQSLEDITNSYQQARARLADAVAERNALLKALARAQTQGQIESIHARIAEARAAIGRAAGEVRAVSRRAAHSDVEVTVLGNRQPGSSGLTLHSGLHDVGRVLLVTLVALAIAAAVLVPLSLVVLVGLAAWRIWLRHRRERVLSQA